MKKHKISYLILLLIIVISNQSLFAQKGEKYLGVKGGYSTFNNSAYTAIQFQYSFSKNFRISPEAGYMFSNNGLSGFEFSVDMHFPFRIARGLKLYPLAGVSFNNWNWQNTHTNKNRFGIDLGGGLDLYLTNSLKVSAQAKYSLMKNTSGAFFDIGIGYIF